MTWRDDAIKQVGRALAFECPIPGPCPTCEARVERVVDAAARTLRQRIEQRLAEAFARYEDSDEAQDGAAAELQWMLALLGEQEASES